MAWQRRAGEAWRADLAGENHAARLEHGEAADERSDGLVGERCDCRGAVHVEAADDAWIGMVPEVADRAQQAQRGLQLGLKIHSVVQRAGVFVGLYDHLTVRVRVSRLAGVLHAQIMYIFIYILPDMLNCQCSSLVGSVEGQPVVYHNWQQARWDGGSQALWA